MCDCILLYVQCVLVVLIKLSVLDKWLAIERPSDDTYMRWGDYLHKAQVEEHVCVYFSFVWFVYVQCFPMALHNIYFILLWHDIAYVLKVPLNTKQTDRQTLRPGTLYHTFVETIILLPLGLLSLAPSILLFFCLNSWNFQTLGWVPRMIISGIAGAGVLQASLARWPDCFPTNTAMERYLSKSRESM